MYLTSSKIYKVTIYGLKFKPASTMTKANETKRTLKYLSVVRNRKAYQAVVGSASDDVVKRVCDAALNAIKSPDIKLNAAQKKLFKKHRKHILKLADRKTALKNKRRLVQTGGFAWIPALIGTVAGALGTALFGGNKQ